MADDHDFCRAYLRMVHADVRELGVTHVTPLGSWITRSGTNPWAEVTLPVGFIWKGSCHCLYDARAKAWEAWEEKKLSEKDNG